MPISELTIDEKLSESPRNNYFESTGRFSHLISNGVNLSKFWNIQTRRVRTSDHRTFKGGLLRISPDTIHFNVLNANQHILLQLII